jgi:hypothetical protein
VFENPVRFLSQSPKFRIRPGVTTDVTQAAIAR